MRPSRQSIQHPGRGLLLCLVLATPSSAVGAGTPAAQWAFDGNLYDSAGRGNDALAGSPEFAAGHKGQGLRCRTRPAVVPDSPDLRIAPGLRIDCWVKLHAIGSSWQPILIKEGEYQLRIDPQSEGGQFSFFAYLDGWEPRVRSTTVPRTGVWYHLSAGWDGREVWIEVDGQVARGPRSGTPVPTDQPLKLGCFDGVLDEVRIKNPQARDNSVATWLFEEDLKDSSGNGHHLAGNGAELARTRSGNALRVAEAPVETASTSELHLAPGLRIDCSVCFEEAPRGSQQILIKDGEYQLRVNPAREGCDFGFFVNVDGWEPRARSDKRVQSGVWYRIMACWDGEMLTLDVNGERDRSGHRGIPKPTENPLRVGSPGLLIDHLRVANPRLPRLRIQDVRQKQGLLRAGRPEPLAVTIRNVGVHADQCAARLELPNGIRALDGLKRDLGALPMGAQRTVRWTVQAETEVRAAAEIRLSAEGCPPASERHSLTFLPAEGLPTIALPAREAPAGVTYYVDSVAGDNRNGGTTPGAPWRDFAKLKGRTLGPGERLLIRRGSVINDELVVSASGTVDNWAEIGAYGTGPQPIIRRNWDIADRCVLVRNPDFLRIRHLNVCYAGKGLVVAFTRGGHQGLLIEDCIAHHIEGLYRPNAHGIPEWRHRKGASGDGLSSSCGIAVMGAAKGVTVRDCEMFQCSWGFRVQGTDVNIDRVYCHDCTVRNTSPHPALTSVYRCIMQNSTFDASGWHASAGTMGIMIVNPQGLTIRNCTFRNMPDVGNHDQGGIDFEALGNGCLIDRCTFENNAGAAIEVLGLKSPQPTNVEIMNSRFIQNNWAHKLGPAEIFIWGRRRDPVVCCSTGWVRGNGYVTLPGVKFFVNEAPTTTSWTVENNTGYSTVEALDLSMPFNRPPVVDAGADVRSGRRSVRLAGRVSDDGRPKGNRLAVRWEVLEGTGAVAFGDVANARTTATFSTPGDYLLRLVVDDGELWLCDTVAVHVLPEGMAVVAAWEFNTSLDKEGWTEVNPGTRLEEWKDQHWPTRAHPVKYVASGYYILAIENSRDVHLLSPDRLGIALRGDEAVTIRSQNHTPASRMRLRFTTDADATWNDAKSRVFKVVPNDTSVRTYTVPMSGLPSWTGRLRQLRLDLATGEALTGTCRIDYVWICRSTGQ